MTTVETVHTLVHSCISVSTVIMTTDETVHTLVHSCISVSTVIMTTVDTVHTLVHSCISVWTVIMTTDDTVHTLVHSCISMSTVIMTTDETVHTLVHSCISMSTVIMTTDETVHTLVHSSSINSSQRTILLTNMLTQGLIQKSVCGFPDFSYFFSRLFMVIFQPIQTRTLKSARKQWNFFFTANSNSNSSHETYVTVCESLFHLQ